MSVYSSHDELKLSKRVVQDGYKQSETELTIDGLVRGPIIHECSSCSTLRSLHQYDGVFISLHNSVKIASKTKYHFIETN